MVGNYSTLQSQLTPDFNLQRDIIPLTAGEAYGSQISNDDLNKKQNQFMINIETIIISAIIFLAIFAWFDYIQTAFLFWLQPDLVNSEAITPASKYWYALFITVFVIFLVYLVHRIFEGNGFLKIKADRLG